MKKWIVMSMMTCNGPTYYVQDNEGNVKPTDFDSIINAQDFADYLNEEEQKKHDKNNIRGKADTADRRKQ